MPDWLTAAGSTGQGIRWDVFMGQLIAAIVLGGMVAAVYRLSHGRDAANSHMMATTLVLLSGLIAMVSIVIGDSVARAFSLVGALSIVRFRTVVDDTRDTAFVIFAVIIGMASGAGLIVPAAISLGVIGVTAIVLSGLPATAAPHDVHELSVRIALGRNVEEAFAPILDKHFSAAMPTSTSTARQGAALELVYDARLRSAEGALEAVRALNRVEGVMGVELRRRG